jgi:hypothetical protein
VVTRQKFCFGEIKSVTSSTDTLERLEETTWWWTLDPISLKNQCGMSDASRRTVSTLTPVSVLHPFLCVSRFHLNLSAEPSI